MESYYCSHCLTMYKEVMICEVCGKKVENKIKIEVQSQNEKK